MATQKVLGVVDINGVFGVNHINNSSPAGAGKVRKPVFQAVGSFSEAIADKNGIWHSLELAYEERKFKRR
jgi:hypothetical protein